MEHDRAQIVRQHLAKMRRELDALLDQAGDFPALECNVARMKSSLNMMAIALGGSVLEES